MANSVVRLSIDSHEFDANIKRAGEALNKFFDQARKGDRTFEVLDDDAMEVIKTFGRMETSSKSARGQLSELTKGFTDLSLIYKRMTDEEKASQPGKIVSEQLNILKDRIAETKGRIAEINGEINGGGGLTGALDQLAGKFGLNIQQLAGWGAAIGAAKVALDVAKDAFFASEATVDEWGRVMDSSKSLYEGFLTALNTGDISGYLGRIDEIVSAARTAYNELDRLGTMKTIQAPQKSAQQTENDRIRQMIQTGRYIAPLDGRKPAPGMKDGQLLTPEQIRRLEQQLQNGMKTVVGLVGNEVKQTGKAIDAVYKRQAKELGMSLSEFRKGTSSMAEFDKRMEEARAYQEFEANKRQAQALASSGHNLTPEQAAMINAINPYKRGSQWSTFRVDGDRYNELVQLILQRDQQAAQAYGMQSQAYRAINRAEGITTRSLIGGGSGGGKTGGGSTTTVVKELSPLQQAQKEISALTEEALTADEARRKVIKEEISDLQKQVEEYKKIQDYVTGKDAAAKVEDPKVNKPLSVADMTEHERAKMEAQTTAIDSSTLSTLLRDSIKNNIDVGTLLDSANLEIQAGIDVPDATWQAIIDEYNALREQIGLEPITIKFETGELEKVGNATNEVGKSMKFAASMTNTLGNALSAIEDPGAKVAATVAQAIANVALAYADTLAKDQTSKWNIFSFIAAAAAASVSMATTIASIHSATGYAEGGIIKGNSYSGDRIGGLVDGSQLVGLNAGELVLTRAMQSNLAGQLQNGGNGSGFASTPYVTGDKIVLGINNWGKKTGRGELVFSRN